MHFDVLKHLLEQGPVTLEVTGDCMQPVLARGAAVSVERRRWLLPGDLIVFSRGGQDVVTHRFLGYFHGTAGLRFVTRADRADSVDSPFGPDQLLGRVVRIDGRNHRPGIGQRARSLAGWAIWVTARLASRLTPVARKRA